MRNYIDFKRKRYDNDGIVRKIVQYWEKNIFRRKRNKKNNKKKTKYWEKNTLIRDNIKKRKH